MAEAAIRTLSADQALDARTFREEVVGSCAPAIIRGLVSDWPAAANGRVSWVKLKPVRSSL